MNNISSLFIFTLFAIPSLAGFWPNWDKTSTKNLNLINQMDNLQGVFKGKSLKSKASAYMMIYKMQENGENNGRFIIYLLTDGTKYGQAFEAEILDKRRSRIALLPIIMTDGDANSAPLKKVAGTLELVVKSSKKRTLRITSKDSKVLAEDIIFSRVTKDYSLMDFTPTGSYKKKKDFFLVQNNGRYSFVLNGKLKALGLRQGYYTADAEHLGLFTVRPEVIDSSINAYSSSKVVGIVVPVLEDNDRILFFSKLNSNGTPSKVVMMEEE